jgi:hypothetical protein
MKNIICLFIITLSVIGITSAQTNVNIGGGYFGHTVSHPGIVLEFELEKMFTENASLPLRIDAGFYSHPRNHNGYFLEVNYGYRRYFKSGLFLEESIGVGVLATVLNNEVFEVNDEGVATEVSKFNVVDFMPSLTLGIGYNLTKKSDTQNLIWLRPKIFWQFPHKTTSTWNPVVQFGFTHTIK